MLRLIKKGVSKLNDLLNKPKEQTSDNIKYLEYLVKKHKNSETLKLQMTGVRYYEGDHDILKKQREVINEDGQLEPVTNLPNAKIVDNQYEIAVKKKTNYLLGRKPTFGIDGENLTKEDLKQDALLLATQRVFNNQFNLTFKNILTDSLNCGIAYLYLYINDSGELAFKRLRPYQVYPVWKDDDHTELSFLLRIYKRSDFINGGEKENEYVEVYDNKGITRYKNVSDVLEFQEFVPYVLSANNEALTWQDTIPVIPFKYNTDEIPLIKKVKSLQDGINELISNFDDNLKENPRNSILVIRNYDGQNLGEFRKNLATFGAVKVRDQGGVEVLQVDVNSENYRSILQVLKNAFIENAKTYDAKDDRLTGNPNMMNIQSMYSDIDIDCNGIETEYKASFEKLMIFVKMYLEEVKRVQFNADETVEIIFNKDVLINESQVISDIRNSVGILSRKTMLENHPYIDNVAEELERIKVEKEEMMNEMQDMKAYGEANRGVDDNE